MAELLAHNPATARKVYNASSSTKRNAQAAALHLSLAGVVSFESRASI
jgi:hypothetical protein